MQEILSHPTSSPARFFQNQRFKWGPTRVAFLLVLVATGLGLLRWMSANPDAHTGVQENSILPARESPHSEQDVAPSGSFNEILAHPDIIPTHRHSLLGQQAPDFELSDAKGKLWSLREVRDGHLVVLIFYYGPQCIQCVRQLANINRDLSLFREADAQVVAIIASPAELMQEQSQQSSPFGFPLLSDPGNKVAQAYRVFREAQDGKATMAFVRHGIFIIGRDGTVQWANVGDAPVRRNAAILSQLAKAEGRLQ